MPIYSITGAWIGGTVGGGQSFPVFYMKEKYICLHHVVIQHSILN